MIVIVAVIIYPTRINRAEQARLSPISTLCQAP